MKIFVWGYYGTNYGDNIMLSTIIDYLKKRFTDISVVSTEDVSDIFKTTKIKHYNLKTMTKTEKLKLVIHCSRKNVLNIYGGGTIFTNKEGDGNFKYFKLIRYLGGKYGYLSIGMEKITNKNRIKATKYLLRNSLFCTFRDKGSLDIASSLVTSASYYLTEDLAYEYLREFTPVFPHSKNYIVIAWRNIASLFSYDYQNYLMDLIVSSIKIVSDKFTFSKIVLLITDESQDTDNAYLLKQKIDDIDFNGVTEVFRGNHEEITNLLAHSNMNISARLHCSLVSEFYARPTLSIAYSRKINTFYNSISSTNFIDLTNRPLVDLADVYRIIHSEKEKFEFSELVDKAQINFEVLAKYIGDK